MTNDAAAKVLRALEETPRWLSDALVASGGSPAPRDDGEWGIAEIIGHLRASDAILAPRVPHILIRPGVTLAAFDERAWAVLASAADLPLSEQLTEFTLRRRELVGILRSLSPEQWQTAGEHETRGTMTVAQAVASTAEHEAEHRIQVEALLGASREG